MATESPPRPSLGEQLGLRAGDALIVVDMQRDFLPGGSLAVQGADDIVAGVNAYLAAFNARSLPIFLTRDWHPPDHGSFKHRGGSWPPHCVQGTAGAEWAEGLQVPASAHVISKGMEIHDYGYSAFSNVALFDLLRAEGSKRVFVAGVATDYCVRATVLDARKVGFEVILLGDAIRAVNREHGDESRALREMMESGASIFERSHLAAKETLVPPPSNREIHQVDNYGFGIAVTLPFADAVSRVIQALQNEGFGIVSDIDMAATLNTKLGVSMSPYRILGACSPSLARRAIDACPEIGLLLPCNVVVRQPADDGVVRIDFLDPNVLSKLSDDEDITELAHQVRRKLRRVIDWI